MKGRIYTVTEIGSITSSTTRDDFNKQIAALRQERNNPSIASRLLEAIPFSDATLNKAGKVGLGVAAVAGTAAAVVATAPVSVPVALAKATAAAGTAIVGGVALTGCPAPETPVVVEEERDLKPCEFFGYKDPHEGLQFSPFLGDVDWNYIVDENLSDCCRGKTAWGTYGVNDIVIEPADVTDKDMAIMRRSPTIEGSFTSNGQFLTLVYMWAKGDKSHEEGDPYDPSKPRLLNINGHLTSTPPFLVGTDADKYWLNGIAMQNPNWKDTRRFAIVLNMTNDPVTGTPAPTEGAIGYPGTEEIIWYNIGYDENGIPFNGMPEAPWVQYDEDFNRYTFGTIAKIYPKTGESYESFFKRKVEFLKTNIIPVAPEGLAPVVDEPETGIESNTIYFNPLRGYADSANANGYAFYDMELPSALYVSPQGQEAIRTEGNSLFHVQLRCVDINEGSNGEGTNFVATKIFLDE